LKIAIEFWSDIIGYNGRVLPKARFLAQKFACGALNPLLRQYDVMRSPFFLGRCLSFHCRVAVCWLGSSFANLVLALA